MDDYDHKNPTKYTLEECENVIGKRAKITLVGTIVEARVSNSGPYVMFKPDERFGISLNLGFDLDVFELDEGYPQEGEYIHRADESKD